MQKASQQRFDIVKSLQKLNIPDKQVAKAVGLSVKTIGNYKRFDTYEEYSVDAKRKNLEWRARKEVQAQKIEQLSVPLEESEAFKDIHIKASPRTQAIVALATAISQLVDVLIEEKQ